MRANNVSALHNCSFEQFIQKRITSVYRSVNRYWKKKFNDLLLDYNQLNAKLLELTALNLLELHSQITSSAQISPELTAETVNKPVTTDIKGIPEITDFVEHVTESTAFTLNETAETKDIKGNIPEVTAVSWENSGEISDIVEYEAVLKDHLPEPFINPYNELIEKISTEPEFQSNPKKEISNSDLQIIEPSTATYKILRKDKKKKRATVQIFKGSNTHKVEFDYSDEDDFKDQINDYCNIDNNALMSVLQKKMAIQRNVNLNLNLNIVTLKKSVNKSFREISRLAGPPSRLLR
jgi:hypothetical protein